MIWGLFLAIGPASLAYLAGVHWTDYIGPEWGAVVVGVITILLRGITSTPVGTSLQQKLFGFAAAILVGLALLCGVGEVRAADMPVFPVKAQNTPFSTPNGSGWYVGIGTQAGVAATNVSGTNLLATDLATGNLNATGGAVGGGFGYISTLPALNGLRWQFENNAFYQNITASVGPVSVASRWSLTQELDVSFAAFQTISNAIGNLGVSFPTFAPALPSNIAVATTPWQFVGFKIEEFGLQGNFFQAGGASVGWAPGLTAGFRWQTLNAQGKPNDGSIKLYADVFWPQRGTTFDNVLGPGAPVVTGTAKFTTQYWAGIKYDFGI